MEIGHAPDLIEPIVGWRVWHVVERRGELRLCSPLYRTTWPLRQELIANCRHGVESMLAYDDPSPGRHSPPQAGCACGIHAAQTAAQAVPYLTRFFRRRDDVLHRVVGRVSLWGRVVECERGWRGSLAYPAFIYVPAPTSRPFPLPRGLPRPSLPPEEIALALAAYGVPVELLGCATAVDVASSLR